MSKAVSSVTNAVSNVVSSPVKAITNPFGVVGAIGGQAANNAGYGSIAKMIDPVTGLTGGYKAPNSDSSNFNFNLQMEGQPTWQGITTSNGELDKRFQLQGGPKVEMDQRATSAIRDRGLSQGDSPWAVMAKEKQALDTQKQLESAQQQSASGVAQARNNMAMRGGISSGAAERLARNANKDLTMRNQEVARLNNEANLNIGMQDDKMKMDSLNSAMGADRSNAELALTNRNYDTGIASQNRATLLGEVGDKRAFDMGLYKERMAAKGAEATANAQMAASRGKK